MYLYVVKIKCSYTPANTKQIKLCLCCDKYSTNINYFPNATLNATKKKVNATKPTKCNYMHIAVTNNSTRYTKPLCKETMQLNLIVTPYATHYATYSIHSNHHCNSKCNIPKSIR